MNEQPNVTLKLLAGGGAGSLVIIIVWALETWATVHGQPLKVPTDVAMALSTVISLAAAHYTPIGNFKSDALDAPGPHAP